MAGLAGYRYCSNCEVEAGPDEVACWLCGGLMPHVPFKDEDGVITTSWAISAGTWCPEQDCE